MKKYYRTEIAALEKQLEQEKSKFKRMAIKGAIRVLKNKLLLEL